MDKTTLKKHVLQHLSSTLDRELTGKDPALWEGIKTPFQEQRLRQVVQEIREEFQRRSAGEGP